MSGRVFVISGPSGSGKTSIVNAVKKRFPEIYYSVSATTREKRKNEKNNKDYIFLSIEEFKENIKKGNFLEYARVFNDYYGTLRDPVERALKEGKSVLVDVDVKGAMNVKKTYPEAVMIFILPPGMDEIKRRLERRKTEKKKIIDLRLKVAKKELEFLPFYNYIILNDDLKNAIDDMVSIIEFENK